MYEYYSVGLYQEIANVGENSLMAQVLNSFISAVNSKPRLPRFLIVLLDMDIMSEFNLEMEKNVIYTFRKIMFWFVKQIKMIIRRAQLSIAEKKPGAI